MHQITPTKGSLYGQGYTLFRPTISLNLEARISAAKFVIMEIPINDSTLSGTIKIRGHRAGDMGYITYRHGAIYAKEHGCNGLFEALVGKITSDFLCNYDPVKERCWIAEAGEEFLGCIMLVKEPEAPSQARVRCFLVEEGARGSGLGTNLIKLCIDTARELGYERIVLSTSNMLGSARRLYARFGFRLEDKTERDEWGLKHVMETWKMEL